MSIQELFENPKDQIGEEEKERRLNQYLECETLLQKFFELVGYCREECAPNAEGIERTFGCCLGEYYHTDRLFHPEAASALELLEQRRVRKYGAPRATTKIEVINMKPCGYHTQEGCALQDHRPPYCISYACNRLVNYILQEFRIDFDSANIHHSLIRMLSGAVDDQEFEKFKVQLQTMLNEAMTFFQSN